MPVKCVNCRHRLKKNDPICPNCSFDMSHYIQEQAELPTAVKLKKFALPLVAIALVMAVGLGTVSYFANLTPAKITVAAALSSTSQQLKSETTAMRASLPILTYLDQIQEAESTLALSSTLSYLPGSAQISMDMAGAQYKVDTIVSDGNPLAVTGWLSSDAAVVDLADSGNILGFALPDLPTSLAASAFAYLFDLDAIEDGYREDMLETLTQLDDAWLEIFADTLTQLALEWEVTQLEDETLTINGQVLDTTAYQLDLDPQALRDIVSELVAELFASPVYSPYLSLLAHQLGTTLPLLEIQVLDGIFYLLDDMIQIDNCDFVLNLYQGRVVLLTAGYANSNSSTGYAIALSPTGNLLDYMAIASRSGDTLSPYLTASHIFSGGAFTANYNLLGSDYTLHYFTQDTSDNFIISAGGENLLVATVDCTQPDSLTLIFPLLDGYITAESALTDLDTGWFNPPSYTDLLAMSQTDLMLLAMALSF